MVTRMLLKLRPDVSCTTSGRIRCYVGTQFLLHRVRFLLHRVNFTEKARKSANMQTIAQIVCLIYIQFTHTYQN